MGLISKVFMISLPCKNSFYTPFENAEKTSFVFGISSQGNSHTCKSREQGLFKRLTFFLWRSFVQRRSIVSRLKFGLLYASPHRRRGLPLRRVEIKVRERPVASDIPTPRMNEISRLAETIEIV